MRCYLSTPGSQAQAHGLNGRNVLISFAYSSTWIDRYIPTFDRLLWDSGAFTAFTKGKAIDLDAYAERARSVPWADGAACLDDIAGDWRKGLANWDAHPWMFPVYHDTDPPEALDAILERMQDIDRARFRPQATQWIGLGMKPPRTSRRWLAETLSLIPPGVHVHGFAMRGFTDVLIGARGADCSADSVNWMLDARKYNDDLPWLTPAESVEIVAKRYEREFKQVATRDSKPAARAQVEMFGRM
jgi:hypothetical protein